MPEDMNS